MPIFTRNCTDSAKRILPYVKSRRRKIRSTIVGIRRRPKFPVELRSLETRPAGNRVTHRAWRASGSSVENFAGVLGVVVVVDDASPRMCTVTTDPLEVFRAEFRLLTRTVRSDCYVSPLTRRVGVRRVRGALVNQLKPLWPSARHRGRRPRDASGTSGSVATSEMTSTARRIVRRIDAK